MPNNVGLWIDHKQAIVVFVGSSSDEVKLIESDADRHRSAHEVAADDVRERHFEHQLNAYYERVLDCLKDADAIFVFGPGEAKGEFKKQIKSKVFQERIVAVETADKMTQNQVVAKVKAYFA